MEKNKIFISHRHSDTQSDCRALKSELQKHFGKENVFLDIENLEPGIKFAEAIEKTLAQSKVVLVAIGPDWFGAEDQNGVSRLFQPKDWVRREVAASLASSDTRVIPILLKGVTVPEVDHLPDDLKSLAELQAAEIDNKRWDYDVSELVKVLEKIVPKKRDPTPHPEPVSRPATFAPPPAKPKSWWAKNYLWMIGGLVGFLILVGMCAPDEEYINPIDNDTIARDQLVQEAEALVDSSPNQDPRVTNPEGNEIYESLTFEEKIPDFAGKWWLFENGIRSGYFQFEQNGAAFTFTYYLFDIPVGSGSGYYEENGIVTESFIMKDSPGNYGFAFLTEDGGNNWVGQTFANQVTSQSYLVKN